MRLPEAVLVQTVTANLPTTSPRHRPDMILLPDPNSIRLVPWAKETGGDSRLLQQRRHAGGTCRRAMCAMLQAVRNMGWGRWWRRRWSSTSLTSTAILICRCNRRWSRTSPETGRPAYSIDAVNEYDDMFGHLRLLRRTKSGHRHVDSRSGACQMEINFLHGDALTWLTRVFFCSSVSVRPAAISPIWPPPSWLPMENELARPCNIHMSA